MAVLGEAITDKGSYVKLNRLEWSGSRLAPALGLFPLHLTVIFVTDKLAITATFPSF